MLYFRYEDFYKDVKRTSTMIDADNNVLERHISTDFSKPRVVINKNIRDIYFSHKKMGENYTRDQHSFYSAKFKELLRKDIVDEGIIDIFEIGYNHYQEFSNMKLTQLGKGYILKKIGLYNT